VSLVQLLFVKIARQCHIGVSNCSSGSSADAAANAPGSQWPGTTLPAVTTEAAFMKLLREIPREDSIGRIKYSSGCAITDNVYQDAVVSSRLMLLAWGLLHAGSAEKEKFSEIQIKGTEEPSH
jgi:hypothetical protein